MTWYVHCALLSPAYESSAQERAEAEVYDTPHVYSMSLQWVEAKTLTASSPSLAALRAAMLIRLARSAPLKPGVPLAMTCTGHNPHYSLLF